MLIKTKGMHRMAKLCVCAAVRAAAHRCDAGLLKETLDVRDSCSVLGVLVSRDVFAQLCCIAEPYGRPALWSRRDRGQNGCH